MVVVVLLLVVLSTLDEPHPARQHATINSAARHIETKLTGRIAVGVA